MSFIAALPVSGIAGWSLLARTRSAQQQALNSSPAIRRDTEYFRANIANVKTTNDLVADRRLLSVALGAFGLDDDINNRFFIRKILEDGVLDTKALANRLSDKRYYSLSKAFGFGDFSVANTQLSDFPTKIISAFQDRQFEKAVGKQDENLRLAMGVERDLGDILAKDTTKNGFWFSVMGTPPLRRVFETAMNLPTSLGALGLDQQVKSFRQKADKIFGNGELAQFSDPAKREELVRLFLVRAEIGNGPSPLTPGAAAIALLQDGIF
jgi:Protein of unknown function (DUF1217)